MILIYSIRPAVHVRQGKAGNQKNLFKFLFQHISKVPTVSHQQLIENGKGNIRISPFNATSVNTNLTPKRTQLPVYMLQIHGIQLPPLLQQADESQHALEIEPHCLYCQIQEWSKLRFATKYDFSQRNCKTGLPTVVRVTMEHWTYTHVQNNSVRR